MPSFKYFLAHPKKITIPLLTRFGGWMPDKLYLKCLYSAMMGQSLNLDVPKTFSEKLQWLKLNDRKPEYHQMVDKFECKSLITNIIGGGYAVPTLGVFDSFEQIEWDKLPDKFILKPTFDSGTYYIVNNKNSINKKEVKQRLYEHWNKDFYKLNREWQYKGLKHRIIAEPLIAEPKNLREYKFFCFNGEPKFYQICLDRNLELGGSVVQFVDMKGGLLNIRETSYNNRKSTNEKLVPDNYEKMVMASRLFARNTYFLRVDFFETDDLFYIGELTFHESGGFCSFEPDEWNYTLGSWIRLPIDK